MDKDRFDMISSVVSVGVTVEKALHNSHRNADYKTHADGSSSQHAGRVSDTMHYANTHV